jgi:hypothetical protein
MIPLERGDQCGHVGAKFVRIDGVLSEIWTVKEKNEKNELQILRKKMIFFCLFFLKKKLKQPQRSQYCHCHFQTTTIRTVPTSSFQRHHCHPATATR